MVAAVASITSCKRRRWCHIHTVRVDVQCHNKPTSSAISLLFCLSAFPYNSFDCIWIFTSETSNQTSGDLLLTVSSCSRRTEWWCAVWCLLQRQGQRMPSSYSKITGWWSVILGRERLPKVTPMLLSTLLLSWTVPSSSSGQSEEWCS